MKQKQEQKKENLNPGWLGNIADDEIYRENIIDHYKNPRNFGKLTHYTFKHKDTNTSCGDEVEIFVLVEQDKVKEVKFFGRGCAISVAAASMLTEHLQGKTLKELQSISTEDILEMLGINLGIVRQRCGLLCLKALNHSMNKEVRSHRVHKGIFSANAFIKRVKGDAGDPYNETRN